MKNLNASKLLRQWYHGKKIRLDPEAPDNYGGIGVMHDYKTEYHWSAKLVRAIVAFCVSEWKWILATIFSAIGAFAAAVKIFCP